MSRGKLLQIKKRINATQSLKKITKAMEMVSTAQIKKVEKRLQMAREFLKEAHEMVSQVHFEVKHPFVTGQGKNALVVIGTDMGLCGAFPSELAKKALELDRKENFDLILVVGAKLAPVFRRNPKVERIYEHEFDVPTFEFSRTVISDLVSANAGRVKVVYGKFKNKLAQVPDVYTLAPIQRREELVGDRYEYEPSDEAFQTKLLEFYAASVFYALAFETKISELYARQNAMRNATENAEEVVRQLTIAFNKARQASITQELIEIVTGADALKSE
ncbi:ATP synthase F1 subunit gamma [Fervidobacterium thailandense]|uniref:ATP synthase gamma chain n=1 Tax=Fervidobacterium thailandense TaxID=1008305 RepID=A0A1E3G292_9BACT|nr:ATP synthase F1 subunit gamma [Fervidobacterium thailandense]ODN29768.1 F0F1 ATP synthase subunit gamma [Fervidobacterium thailandense]